MQSKPRLIIIPVIHTRADYGSLGSEIPEEYETVAIRYWQAVSEYIRGLPVDFSKLRIYQDGLPDAPIEIVARFVDGAQTPNYELLRWLRGSGANITGTESPPLLAQERRALQTIFYAENEEQKHAARKEYQKEGAFLLEARDAYIAQRIRDTLPQDGIGILFLGLAHEVKRLLEQEMEVSEPETLIGSSSETLRKKISRKEKET